MQSHTATEAAAERREATRLRLLILEGSEPDAQLAVAELQRAGYLCQWDRVQTRQQFLAHLEEMAYDVILADYRLPAFDGLSALALVRQRDGDIPFILVAGALGEETAIESLKAGATDYVVKTRLERLGPVVQRALIETAERRHRRHAEEALRESEAKLAAVFHESLDDLTASLTPWGDRSAISANLRDVTERKFADERVLSTSEFVATISHELRTPLNAIVGYNDLLLDGAFGGLTAEQAHTLQRMRANSRVLRDLIDETLDLSRLETGRVHLDLRDLCVSDLLTEIDAETEEMRQRPSVNFSWALPERLPMLRTDPTKLKLVLKNLIGNAMKFTEAGSVHVAVAERNEGIEFRVVDTGPGIAPDALPIIFEAFRQADSSTTRRHGGVGLGLYIVRRLLHVLGGTITVESRVGHGSAFQVWIPAVVAP